MTDDTIAGAILAGGQARRFGGQDKCRLLAPDGRSIIIRQRDLLQRVAASVFIVTTRADIASRPDRFSDLDLPVLTDIFDGEGTLAGIHAAVTHSAAPRVLVVGCDQPFLTPELLAALADRARGADGAWVRSARGPEPLIACYQKRTAERIAIQLASGARRAAGLESILTMRDLGLEELKAFGEPALLTANVNSAPEFQAALELAARTRQIE